MEIQFESKLTMVYIQILRTVLVHGPVTAGSPLSLFYLKADPAYEKLYFSLRRLTMFKISVITKAWKCPNCGSGHGLLLLAVGTRNLLDSGNRQLLALETGQLLAAGNSYLFLEPQSYLLM
jgi:hypothetical protein